MKCLNNSKGFADLGLIIAAVMIGITILGGTGYLSHKSGMAYGGMTCYTDADCGTPVIIPSSCLGNNLCQYLITFTCNIDYTTNTSSCANVTNSNCTACPSGQNCSNGACITSSSYPSCCCLTSTASIVYDSSGYIECYRQNGIIKQGPASSINDCAATCGLNICTSCKSGSCSDYSDCNSNPSGGICSSGQTCCSGSCALPQSNAKCNDSDGGINYYLFGKLNYTLDGITYNSAEDWCSTNNGNGGYTNYCNGTNCILVEEICSNITKGSDWVSYNCPNGCSNGACINQTQTTPTCTGPDGTIIQNNSSKTYYLTSSVPYGVTCASQSQSRICLNGVLSGSYQYPSCTIQSAPKYTLSISKSGTGSGTVTSSPSGINCGSTCSYLYNSGTSVALTAIPYSGVLFSGWFGACSGTSSTCVVSMNAAKSVAATFTPTCTIESNSSFCARYNKTCGNYTNIDNCGSSRTTVCGTCSSGQTCSNGACITPTPNYILSIIKYGNGTVTSSPTGINCGNVCNTSFTNGTKVDLSATPATGFRFSNWVSGSWFGNCDGNSSTCSIWMMNQQTVYANFTIQTPTCANECNQSGLKRCSTSSPYIYNTCGNYDNDSCLEWSSSITCPSGQVCSNGACITLPQICANECSSSGLKQCVSSYTYKTCGNYDKDSCLEWSTTSSCQYNQKCSNGQCVSAGYKLVCEQTYRCGFFRISTCKRTYTTSCSTNPSCGAYKILSKMPC